MGEQRDGILKHAGIKDLMDKLGNAIDAATLQSHREQLMHAGQHAPSNCQASEKSQRLTELTEKVLS